MEQITIPILYWWCMYIINLGAFLLIGLLIGEKITKNDKLNR